MRLIILFVAAIVAYAIIALFTGHILACYWTGWQKLIFVIVTFFLKNYVEDELGIL